MRRATMSGRVGAHLALALRRDRARLALAVLAAVCLSFSGIMAARGADSVAPRTVHLALAGVPAPDPRAWAVVIESAAAEWRRHGVDLHIVDARAMPELVADVSSASELEGHDLDPAILSLTVRRCDAAGCRIAAVLNERALSPVSAAPAGVASSTAGAASAAAAAGAPPAGAKAASGAGGRGTPARFVAVAALRDANPAPGQGAGGASTPVAPGTDLGTPSTVSARDTARIAAVLPAVIAHEIGHLLGLEHDDTSPGTIASPMTMTIAASDGTEAIEAAGGVGAGATVTSIGEAYAARAGGPRAATGSAGTADGPRGIAASGAAGATTGSDVGGALAAGGSTGAGRRPVRLRDTPDAVDQADRGSTGDRPGGRHPGGDADAARAADATAASSAGDASGTSGTSAEVAVAASLARSAAAVAAAAALFPPRHETFDFRARLEQSYSAGLGRLPAPTFVDIEGSVVWVQEYLRYRLDGCVHGEAAARVLRQIVGEGVQPSCGPGGWSGVPPFPPRNETFAFRQQLEEVYRGRLGRDAVLSAVDAEGDVVWTQEYLRYRLGGCQHGRAVDAVLAQVDGRPAPPVCTARDDPAPDPPRSGDVVENPSRLAFVSPDHARFSAYQVGFFPPGAGAPVQVVVVPLDLARESGAERVVDLAAAGLVPPTGQVLTFRARGVWSGGVTAWSDPSQPFIRR